MTSFYLHIPFCQTKCCYCAFGSFVGMKEMYKSYISAMRKEISTTALTHNNRRISTLFIGGGTPTVLRPEFIVGLIELVAEKFGFTPDAEISTEANPGTVQESELKILRNGGLNRISFGVQSFNDRELSFLGRSHSAREAKRAIISAQNAGFANINLDLMYGLPGQTAKTWQQSLEQAFSLNIGHLSLYELTVEPGTPLVNYLELGRLSLPSEDEICEMDKITARFSIDTGIEQYEISNYAKKGFCCRHNINYWQNNEYLAVGAGAVSYIAGMRQKRIADPAEYVDHINHQKDAICESEKLSPEASFRESVIMGLRMNRGVSLPGLKDRYGIDLQQYYGKILTRLLGLSLISLEYGRLTITSKGLPLSNQILADLV